MVAAGSQITRKGGHKCILYEKEVGGGGKSGNLPPGGEERREEKHVIPNRKKGR